MSTMLRVAELLGQAFTEYSSCRCENVARILDNAGLLAPDLPAPKLKYSDGGAYWLDSDTTSVEHHYDSASDEIIITTGVAYDLTPTEAKQLAYALLAAANHAEAQANE